MDEMPPGYRFYPTEEELVSFYLNKKLQGTPTPQLDRVIPLLDIYNFNPWDLPQYAGELCHGDPEQWFFFIPRQEKEARGGRPNRLTTTGYWKATGSPGYVYSKDDKIVGLKRTMVFYKGRAPAGRKTQWKMNEYKAIHYPHQAAAAASSSSSSATPKLRQEMSLCRVYIKSKCLRAFDRRPSPGPPLIIGETSTTHQAQSTTITTAGGGGYDQAAAAATATATATSHDHNYYQKTSTTHQAQSTTITTAGGGGYDQAAAAAATATATATSHDHNYYQKTSTTHQAQSTTITTAGGGGYDQAAAAAAAAATATATSHDHNYYQNPTLMTEIITSSPDDTSSSGDPTPMEADATAVDNESLWDLDQLNWFLNQI